MDTSTAVEQLYHKALYMCCQQQWWLCLVCNATAMKATQSAAAVSSLDFGKKPSPLKPHPMAAAAAAATCRIEFLAQVRNMALAPLYSHYASRNSPNPGANSSSSSRPVAPGAVPWDPDYVVFLNDVFFCWSMVLRLMGYRADITCGMDFWQNRGEPAAAAIGIRFAVVDHPEEDSRSVR
jgi:hypothetical protein